MKQDEINIEYLRSHTNKLALILGMHPPSIKVKHSDKFDAHVCGLFKKIIITTTLLNVLNTNEQFAILEHESGHLKRWKKEAIVPFYLALPIITLAFVMMESLSIFPAPWYYAMLPFSFFLTIIILKFDYIWNIKRKMEFEADSTSAKLKNTKALICALKKMEEFDEMHKKPWVYTIINFYIDACFLWKSHNPSIDERIKKLEDVHYRKS